ncbi:bifunctional diguanylate cyclase/phosphodiesterase [Roseospirillum parvum]|uniref:Diguanylate cyclase (GGDEF) domain-containing protein n=1 Tax=Roseospirillum parvum TaxID=83401 RepID=A0A1G7ZPI3_9PROT|nr:bifunctional diguanylate cyclase/phosphodiesterase [Roseospirillum parvum]SDH10487.1 diguanylate cyclase (GGDEF) domain-containing protein [Roseospirillum parvum]
MFPELQDLIPANGGRTALADQGALGAAQPAVGPASRARAHLMERPAGPYQPAFSLRNSVATLPPRWHRIVQDLDIALQPIVGAHGGQTQGFEALIRGFTACGFDDPHGLLDAAAMDGILPELEVALYEKSLAKFATVPGAVDLKLFLNMDCRTLGQLSVVDNQRLSRGIDVLLRRAGLSHDNLVLEISERLPLTSTEQARAAVKHLRRAVGRLALDDFGAGFSDLRLMYFAEPDYIKIDRFFIDELGSDARKKMFVGHMVNMAHLMGVKVIGEGVETDKQFHVCRELGCDFIQGYLVQPPQVRIEALSLSYQRVAELVGSDRRQAPEGDQRLIAAQIEQLTPIIYGEDMARVFERFRADKSATFFPVVDSLNEPMGIVRERDLKEYTYSLYGKDLLSNKTLGRKLKDFIWSCPVADISATAERVLEVFSADETSLGIIMVRDGKYEGFLSARSLLRVINDKNLALARDQNPLTKLPGNHLINTYLTEALDRKGTEHTVAYIDFDNFKPFNDAYGFRQGDRAITLFAELMRKNLPGDVCFLGHVGGDDFFAAFRGMSFLEAQGRVRHLIERFRRDVESFYDEETRQRGYIDAKDREGQMRRFPLLSASAALIEIPAGHAPASLDDIASVIADLKKAAKQSPDRLAAASVMPGLRQNV